MLTGSPLDPSPPGASVGLEHGNVHRDLRERETMFRTIRLTAAALAVAIASLALAGTASAHNRGAAYEFRGEAVVAPGTGATQHPGAGDRRQPPGPQGPARRRAAHDLHDRPRDALDRGARQHAAARRLRHRARRRHRPRRRPRAAPHAARDARSRPRPPASPICRPARARPAACSCSAPRPPQSTRPITRSRSTSTSATGAGSSPCSASPCTRRSPTTPTPCS